VLCNWRPITAIRMAGITNVSWGTGSEYSLETFQEGGGGGGGDRPKIAFGGGKGPYGWANRNEPFRMFVGF